MSDASRLKLCRNDNCVALPGKANPRESRRLSLTTAGSSINAALGSVSAGGLGTPEFDVTQNGGGPSAFVASQSGGSAGGVTSSKFSVHSAGRIHGGEHEGVGTGVGVGVGVACAGIAIAQSSTAGTIVKRAATIVVFIGRVRLCANGRVPFYSAARQCVKGFRIFLTTDETDGRDD